MFPGRAKEKSLSTEDVERGKKLGAVWLSIISNSALVALKLLVGLLTASVSILSEAVHSGMDLVAALIAAYGVKKASYPPDAGHPFGHGKFENISGTVEALLIFGAALYIVVESIRKLFTGVQLQYLEAGLAVMALSAGVNIIVSKRLMRVAKETDSIALEADALHLRTDVYTSLGVLVALGAIYVAGLVVKDPLWRARVHYLDPLVALAVAVMIIRAAYDLTQRSLGGLVDRPLPEHEDRIIRQVLRSYAGEFPEFHDLKHRKSGPERHIEFHLVATRDATVRKVHALCDEIEREIEKRLPKARVLIHVEPCSEVCPRCQHCEVCEGKGE
jgi:cation diffusion facilitator family transporter